MPYYFYITIVSVVIVFIMSREIYLFNQEKYYPYLTWNKEDSFKKRMVDFGLLIVLFISFHNLSSDTKPPILFLLLVIALPLCVNILNLLSYAKIKDRKIIKHIVILDISIIAYFVIVQCIIRLIIP